MLIYSYYLYRVYCIISAMHVNTYCMFITCSIFILFTCLLYLLFVIYCINSICYFYYINYIIRIIFSFDNVKKLGNHAGHCKYDEMYRPFLGNLRLSPSYSQLAPTNGMSWMLVTRLYWNLSYHTTNIL